MCGNVGIHAKIKLWGCSLLGRITKKAEGWGLGLAATKNKN
jgi:hypothetical protein